MDVKILGMHRSKINIGFWTQYRILGGLVRPVYSFQFYVGDTV